MSGDVIVGNQPQPLINTQTAPTKLLAALAVGLLASAVATGVSMAVTARQIKMMTAVGGATMLLWYYGLPDVMDVSKIMGSDHGNWLAKKVVDLDRGEQYRKIGLPDAEGVIQDALLRQHNRHYQLSQPGTLGAEIVIPPEKMGLLYQAAIGGLHGAGAIFAGTPLNTNLMGNYWGPSGAVYFRTIGSTAEGHRTAPVKAGEITMLAYQFGVAGIGHNLAEVLVPHPVARMGVLCISSVAASHPRVQQMALENKYVQAIDQGIDRVNTAIYNGVRTHVAEPMAFHVNMVAWKCLFKYTPDLLERYGLVLPPPPQEESKPKGALAGLLSSCVSELGEQAGGKVLDGVMEITRNRLADSVMISLRTGVRATYMGYLTSRFIAPVAISCPPLAMATLVFPPPGVFYGETNRRSQRNYAISVAGAVGIGYLWKTGETEDIKTLLTATAVIMVVCEGLDLLVGLWNQRQIKKSLRAARARQIEAAKKDETAGRSLPEYVVVKGLQGTNQIYAFIQERMAEKPKPKGEDRIEVLGDDFPDVLSVAPQRHLFLDDKPVSSHN